MKYCQMVTIQTTAALILSLAEDFKLMKELGLKAFRTSIAWTRIYQMVMMCCLVKKDCVITTR